MKWYLISEEDYKDISDMLNQIKCKDHVSTSYLRSAQHTLDSGLHTTLEIPEDYKNA